MMVNISYADDIKCLLLLNKSVSFLDLGDHFPYFLNSRRHVFLLQPGLSVLLYKQNWSNRTITPITVMTTSVKIREYVLFHIIKSLTLFDYVYTHIYFFFYHFLNFFIILHAFKGKRSCLSWSLLHPCMFRIAK